jgi:hypothetical protein
MRTPVLASLRLVAFLLVPLVSCNPLTSTGGGGTAGACNTANGPVNTYTIYGSWKKTSGYDPPRSAAELNSNYDILIVLPGSKMCKLNVVNDAVEQTEYLGTYTHAIDAKTLEFTYLAGANEGSVDSLTYAFSGSCDRTNFNLTYQAGGVEKYTVISKDLSRISCGE